MSKYEHKSAKDKAFEKERIQFRHRIHDLEAENKQLRQTIREQAKETKAASDAIKDTSDLINHLFVGAFGHLL